MCGAKSGRRERRGASVGRVHPRSRVVPIAPDHRPARIHPDIVVHLRQPLADRAGERLVCPFRPKHRYTRSPARRRCEGQACHLAVRCDLVAHGDRPADHRRQRRIGEPARQPYLEVRIEERRAYGRPRAGRRETRTCAVPSGGGATSRRLTGYHARTRRMSRSAAPCSATASVWCFACVSRSLLCGFLRRRLTTRASSPRGASACWPACPTASR